MTSKKKDELNKYCRIFRWIETQDSEFAEVIRDLCLERALTPGIHQSGVTFLYPKDKAYRQEIITNAYSKDADEAVRMLESLIIPDALLHSTDFKQRPIGSKLGVKYDVESTEHSLVKLANGIELTPVDNFHTLTSRKGKLAVWFVTKGRLPLVGKEYKPVHHKLAHHGVKSSKARHGGAAEQPKYRQQLAVKLSRQFVECMKKDKCVSHNPYLDYMVSLLNFLDVKHNDILLKVKPLLDYEPVISFYILIEPFKTKGELLIPDSVLFGPNGFNGTSFYKDAVTEYTEFFNDMCDSAKGANCPLVYCNRSSLNAQIEKLRQKYQGTTMFKLLPLFEEDYKNLLVENKLNGVGPVLPESTKSALTWDKKLWQDELRYDISSELNDFYKQYEFDEMAFNKFFDKLHKTVVGNEYIKEATVCNQADLKTSVSAKCQVLAALKAVNCSDLLYLAVCTSLVGENEGSLNPNSSVLYNRNRVALDRLLKITGMHQKNGLSESTVQAVLLAMQKYKVPLAELGN